MKSKVFEVTISGMHSIQIPEKIARPFVDTNQKRVKVVASFEDRQLELHAALQKRKGSFFIMFSKGNQKAIGVFPNDYFQLQLFKDTTKYGVKMSEELEAVLMSDYDAFKEFETLTDGKKRGIIYMISRYKNSQTRIDKSIVLCENLKRGIKDPKLLFKSF